MSTPKNILFFLQSLSLKDGGVPRVTDIVSAELDRRGHRSFFVHGGADNPGIPAAQKMQIAFDMPTEQAIAQVLAFVKRYQIDVLVCQNVYDGVYVDVYQAIRREFKHIRLVTFLHASPSYWMPLATNYHGFHCRQFLLQDIKNIIKRQIFKLKSSYRASTVTMYGMSDRFVLLSDRFRKEFSEVFGVSGDRLHVINNPATFSGIDGSLMTEDKLPVLLVVGRMVEDQKRISVILKAWRALSGKYPGWQLKLVGSGRDKDLYQQYIRKNGLNAVELLDHNDDILAHYREASVFLMTSSWEGVPMTLIEAVHTGVVPVVYDNFSSVRDLVEDGVNGFVVPDNNYDLFVQRMGSLMADAGLRDRMMRAGLPKTNRYLINNVVNEWESLFQQLD